MSGQLAAGDNSGVLLIPTPNQSPDNAKYLYCGVLSGALQAAFFNPWDRAMYLSVKERRPFLSLTNWKAPYQGFMQAASHRIVSHGLYFPLESLFQDMSRHYFVAARGGQTGSSGDTATRLQHSVVTVAGVAFDEHTVSTCIGGTMAGTTSAIILHPLATVKYYCWGQEDAKILMAVRKIWQGGRGASVFLRGISSTLCRDMVFGGIFSVVRHREQFVQRVDVALLNASRAAVSLTTSQRWSLSAGSAATNNSLGGGTPSMRATTTPSRTAYFFCNAFAAGFAVSVASPFNYIRNIKLSVPPEERAPSGTRILRNLLDECKWEFSTGSESRFAGAVRGSFAAASLLQNRLKLGVGTLRVAVGMAFGSMMYDLCTGGPT